MSQYPKIIVKMNAFLYSFLNYFETVIHPAAGKNEVQKTKRRNSKATQQLQPTPDCQNTRSSVRKNDYVRRNPAP